MTENSSPYRLAAESVFKIKALQDYLRLFGRILRSPTRNTIETFETAHLSDGIRFLEFGTGFYLFCIAFSGFAVYGTNEIVKAILPPLLLAAGSVTSSTLFYFAMRNKGTKRRTPREVMFFACLTLGFTMPAGVCLLLGQVGTWVVLVLDIPLYVYLTRAWKYFWGASGARTFWTYFGCTSVSVIAGELILLPVYLLWGFPRFS